MTPGETARAADRETACGTGAVLSRVVDVAGVPMSALVAEVARPRAVVLALHGGAVSPAYFDAPGQPRLSLLRTGAALGFTVIALARPGYGASAGHAERIAPARRRVDLAYGAVDALLEAGPHGPDLGAGLFVLAHSVGSELAVRMAADGRGTGLLGLEISGTGRRYHEGAGILDPANGNGLPRAGSIRDLIWGPEHLYPAGIAGHPDLRAAGPSYEGRVVPEWSSDLPELAARVRVPVRYVLAEHETVWRPGRAALDEVAALFTASPRVVVDEQAGAGHNLSLGLAAAAYHLKALAFAEECALTRTRSDNDSSDNDSSDNDSSDNDSSDNDPTGETR